MKKGEMRAKPRFIHIPEMVYDSIAFRSLPDAAARLFLDLRTQYTGGNNGRLRLTLSVLQKRGWTSKSKLERARDELLQRGLIRYTKKCGANIFHHASLFAFCDISVAPSERDHIEACAPTHAYLNFCVPPQKGQNGPCRRGSAAPAEGERGVKTAPFEGERGIASKAAPILDVDAISSKSARSPAGGNVLVVGLPLPIHRRARAADKKLNGTHASANTVEQGPTKFCAKQSTKGRA